MQEILRGSGCELVPQHIHTERHSNASGSRSKDEYSLCPGQNSIDEAIERLEKNNFPAGINAVIFLLHKPAGQGTRGNVLTPEDPRVKRFFRKQTKVTLSG